MIAKKEDQNQIDFMKEEKTYDLDIKKSKNTDTTFNPLLVQHG